MKEITELEKIRFRTIENIILGYLNSLYTSYCIAFDEKCYCNLNLRQLADEVTKFHIKLDKK